MSQSRQMFPQSSTSSSRVSSVSRVHEDTHITGTLRLRAGGEDSATHGGTPARRIRWSEDVVDNEGMGKKSSKVCCIYHKTRPVGESSSESESSDSDSSESDSGSKGESSKPRRSCGHQSHTRDFAQGTSERGRANGDNSHSGEKAQRRKPSPNAYEKIPKYTKR